ncbi:MAG: FG-GAP-like repeat-containing protein [Acidobacteriota bacterium]|nr:FG-GAP-like repeat-containing protein [Acidobacteriota bacterium]
MARRLCPAVAAPAWAVVASAVWAAAASATPPPEALELRHQGVAHLENERPIEAEMSYRSLIEVHPEDPLGHANLAIALLRQQRFDEADQAIAEALARAPGRGDLLAAKAAILLWSGRRDEALPALEAAHAAAPTNLESLYALYRHASAMRGDQAEAAARQAIGRLRELVPENLFVLLKAGQIAVESGDRAGATSAYLRIRELVWQAPDPSEATLATLLDALEENDLAAANRPSRILDNLFRGTPLYTSSLAEIFTDIQGIPIAGFSDEEPATSFGSPVPIHLTVSHVDDAATTAVALVDLDRDGGVDLARLVSGTQPHLEIRLSADDLAVSGTTPAPALERLRPVDLDNDGDLELLAWGGGFAAWKRNAAGEWHSWQGVLGLDGVDFVALAPLDYDIEGDLDLAFVTSDGSALGLLRNTLEGPLEDIGQRVMPQGLDRPLSDLLATDLDRDGDVDLVGVGPAGVVFLDNLRQGRFGDRTAELLAVQGPAAATALSADFDNDGQPELALAGAVLTLLRRGELGFAPWEVQGDLPLRVTAPRDGDFGSMLALDADNDGRLDLALGGGSGFVLLTQPAPGVFVETSVLGELPAITGIATGDLDGDGDLDLVAGGPAGLHRLDNVGGHRNGWLEVELTGLNIENQKNNRYGMGSAIEILAGPATQFREATEPTTHFGLGNIGCPEVMKVTWTNGVPQNRLQVCGSERIVEEQVLKGSCPFLYTEDPDGVHFVTDLLWGAPLGMPVGEGVWAGADIDELIKVEGAWADSEGHYRLHITEELWEAAFFDLTRLHIVDHPVTLQTASNLRVIPGETVEDRILATAAVRPLAWARDGSGRDVTARVAARDEVYADGYPSGPYQGATPEPWSFRFGLGEAPASRVRLLLEGWIFPADASLNLALDQRATKPVLTRLEMRVGDEWQVLMPKMGHPAGKPKTMVVDTPALPAGVSELRIVSSKWLHWDRIAWSTSPADDRIREVATLAPASADLHFRGFSRPQRLTPNGPHIYDYDRAAPNSPWLGLPGSYTRYGNVRELLTEPDDRLVILAPGDELSLVFDASALPPPAPGWTRSVFLESHGWDKDADRNTWQGHQLEPLPFRAQSGYPWAAGEFYPDDPALRRYRAEWLTREVR